MNNKQNQNITAILVDDNPGDIVILKNSIEKSGINLEILGQAESPYECLELLENDIPDLLFLDIDMPGMSGVELAKTILQYENPPLIAFITGRKDFAVEAFELSAIDYVVKPFNDERIKITLEKVIKKIENKQLNTLNIETAINKLSQDEKRNSNKLAVKDYKQRTIRFIDISSIIYIERQGRQVNIVTDKETFPTYFTVDKLAERLSGKNFYKASQSSIINIDYIDHMIPNGDGTYDLSIKSLKNKALSVSRQNAKKILDIFTPN